MLDDGNIVFDIPDHIWEQLNQGKVLDISVPSQPVSSDSSEQKASVSTTTSSTQSTSSSDQSKGALFMGWVGVTIIPFSSR